MYVSARLVAKGGICCGADNPYLLISRARGGGNNNDFVRVF